MPRLQIILLAKKFNEVGGLPKGRTVENDGPKKPCKTILIPRELAEYHQQNDVAMFVDASICS